MTNTGHVAPPAGKNRLALESSPYLLLHADNPVEWYAWGEEAIEKARREARPIFLSVGYSTCYWCHVMERESFADAEVAQLLNRHFVAVKVDREERPDVDSIYMNAVQLMTGQGGWPMSVFLTPDLQPFLGRTYFPRAQFMQLLQRIADHWETPSGRREIERAAGELGERLRELARTGGDTDGDLPAADRLSAVVQLLREHYDERHGGFFDAPKFPQPSLLELLLIHHQRSGDTAALRMVAHTLEAMAGGGVCDQLGGGFHRYATDRSWTVPHFEKMLYDQAQLLHGYARAFDVTGKELFRRVADDIVAYLQREMMSSDGLFFSAQDAEVDGVEGASYVWTADEIGKLLSAEDYALAARVYALDAPPNFEGRHVLRWRDGPGATARALGLDEIELLDRLAPIRRTLREARDRRPQPLLDDKIIAAWNGLAIKSLAYAGRACDRPDWVQLAGRAATALLEEMRDAGGALRHVMRAGSAKLDAYLDDYAAVIEALLALRDATGDERWLQRAASLADNMIEGLWDGAGGGFFYAAPDTAYLPFASKDRFDGASPSGNSLAVAALTGLAAAGHPRYAGYAADTLRAFARDLERQPAALSYMLTALARYEQAGLPRDASARDGGTSVERGPASTAEAVAVKAHWEVRDGGCRLYTQLEIREGWHVNTNPAALEFLVPTEVQASIAGDPAELDTHYPSGELVEGLQDQSISIYSGKVNIVSDLPPLPAGAQLDVTVSVQACDNGGRCLPPERLRTVAHPKD